MNEKETKDLEKTETAEVTKTEEKDTKIDVNEELSKLKNELEKITKERDRFKNSIDKLTHENSVLTKEKRASMSEAEKLEAERIEADAKQKEYIETLENKIKKNEAKSRYLSNGFDDKDAEELSELELSGKMDEIIKKFKEREEKVLKEKELEYINKRPEVKVGSERKDDPEDDITKAFNKGLKGQ